MKLKFPIALILFGLFISAKIYGQKDASVTSVYTYMQIDISDNGYTPVEAWVKNNSAATQSFKVTAEITPGSYKSEKVAEDVEPAAKVLIEFPDFTPANAGLYTVKVYVTLDGDENPVNNEMGVSLYVIDNLPQTYSSLSGAKWITHTAMPASNYGGAAVKSGDNIYYFGGLTTGDAYNTTVYKYDINAQSWSAAGTMPEGKKNFRAFEKNGKVWVEGGAPQGAHSMYVYDIQANSWTAKTDMPYPASNFGAWTIGKYIYTDWGKTFVESEDNATYLFQIYDTENDTWNSEIGLSGTAKYGATSAAIGEYSITAGGYEIAYGTGSDEMFYNVRQDASTNSMIGYKKVYPGGALTGISSAAVSGRGKNYFVFAGGSGNDGKATSQVWIYDLNNSTWLKGPNLAVPVAVASDLVPVIKDDSLFVVLVGGYTTGQVAGYTGATKLNQWLYLGQQDPASLDPQIVDVVLTQGMKMGESAPIKLFVKNNSNQNYSFNVVCKITPGSYSETSSFGELTPGQMGSATLSSFTPSQEGTYYLKAYVPGFADTLTKVIYVAPSWTQVQYSDYDKGYWFTETDYPNRIENGAAAYNAGDKSIYVIGGTVPVTTETGGVSFERSAKVKKYNVDTHEWSDVADAPLATRYTRAVALNNKIYAIGDNADENASIMIYDVNTKVWMLGNEMPVRTNMNALATYSDSLVYCFGGGNIDTYKKASTVQVYNTNTKRWTQIADMPGEGVSDLAVSILDNVIMVAGGSDAVNGNAGSNQLLFGRINETNPLDIAWVTDAFPNGEKWVNLSCGSYSSGNDKYMVVANGYSSVNYEKTYNLTTWIYEVNTGYWYRGPERELTQFEPANFVTVPRNDTTYLVSVGGRLSDYSSTPGNYWLSLVNISSDTTGVGNDEPNSPMPAEYALSQNYPNPFNPTTKIQFALPQSGYVDLKVYNMLGQEISTLVSGYMSAGVHEATFNAAGLNLSSGIYIYRIKAGEYVQTKKLMLIK